jgi:two-component system capsular synthesis sensor histidine kinase RcsC
MTTSGETRGRSVLLVDDSRLARLVARHQLEALGCSVAEAGDGEEALALLEADGAWDVVFVDRFMPGMEGPELIHEFRRRGVTSRIVLVSANDSVCSARGSPAEGIDAFLTKPFDPALLAGQLGKADPALRAER